ncbi:MAG: hypothetical protein BGO51_16945 [Rhodospirillales bacterium 69-11]|nr:hypothetical protein [Rhodospirillales bacterium]MBN8925901.1 hypothetical protein [Rhodospirillales bacterium]OJW21271.1 MAG: hypothetical protein BGO51_16945 [Rhodospirillales bacterium 69-11]
MLANQVTHKHTRRDEASRRSLLTLTAIGIGTLFSRPAQSHQANAAHDTDTRSFIDLKKVGAQQQVRTLSYTPGGTYHVVTADGHGAEFSETDLRFKVDSTTLGPRRGQPVILPAGQVGDRALVFFAAPEEISTFITHQD